MGIFKKHKEEEKEKAVEIHKENRFDVAQYLESPEDRKIVEKSGRQKEGQLKDSINETKEMPLPKILQKASDIGVSNKRREMAEKKEEEPEEEDILDILKHLRDELKEFERIREAIRTKVESTSKLIPKLTERKELLEKDVKEHMERLAEISNIIPKLEQKRQSLVEEIERKKREIELLEKEINENQDKVSEITSLIPRLDQNMKNIQQIVDEKHKEIEKIEEQISQIVSIQKYGLDLVSTLVYADKKNKQ